MALQNKSGCFTDKQLIHLNDKFDELPFEFGTVLDCIFKKITAGGMVPETLTSLTFNKATLELCYFDELEDENKIDLSCLAEVDLPPIIDACVFDEDTKVLTFEFDDDTEKTVDLSCLLDDRPRIEQITLGGPNCDMLTFVRDDSTTIQVDLSPLVDKIKEDLMQPKCGWACDAAGTTVWFVKDDTGITYYTDPTETTSFTPSLPLGPPSSSAERFDSEKDSGWVVDADGNCIFYVLESITDLKLGSVVRNTTYYTGPDLTVTATPVLPLAPKGDSHNPDMLISSEEVTVDDTGAVTLANIPADATGATVQVVSTGCIRYFVDGTTPTATTGYQIGSTGDFILGCLTDSNGDIAELQNFEFISEPGSTSTVTATYYKKV